MKAGKFLTSRVFLKHLGLALAITVVIAWTILYGLKVYTHHGQKLSVPNLYGMSIDEADKVLKENKLRYTILDSVFRPNVAPGAVLEQSPVAGFQVKQKRNIFLTINAKNPEKVRFPNLVNYSFRQAVAILETNGFTVGSLEYIPSDFRNLVLQQKYNGDTIPEGSLVVKGATIDLVLGLGKNVAPILVPTLIGQNQMEAKEKIILSNLNIGRIYFDGSVNTSQDSTFAKVWKQDPTFGENIKLEPGSKVNIYLTRDSTKVPNADSLIQVKWEVDFIKYDKNY